MKPLTFFLVTLGCFRNEVISDLVRSAMLEMGHRESSVLEDADFVLVNTCGFIEDACAEGIDTVLELDRLKSRAGSNAPILLLGCMGQRYGEDLLNEMPEVAGVLGVDWYGGLERALVAMREGKQFAPGAFPATVEEPHRSVDSFEGPTLLVRIAEGCDRGCSFCTIPTIKGGYRSRPCEEILEEIQRLCAGEQREVILLSQDATAYGKDMYGKQELTRLIKMVSELDCTRWLRLLYLQPEGVTGELVEEMGSNPKVCDYFDIPFQHASAPVLRRMGRPGDAADYRRLISLIRDSAPEAALRTTMMVGFPGETEDDFGELLRFLEQARFDWVGAFRFSAEEGTRAATLEGAVSADIAVSRYNEVVRIQDSIEESAAERLVGRSIEVVIDGGSSVPDYELVGRSYREAPIVDGVVYLKDRTGGLSEVRRRGFAIATIVGREGLDLVGEI